MTGQQLIEIIQKNKLQEKDVTILVKTGLWVTAKNIVTHEISDEEDCLFLEIDMSGWILKN